MATAVLKAPPSPTSIRQSVPPSSGETLATLDLPAFAVTNPRAERQRLVQRCTGETIHVENLMSLMPAWFKKIQPQKILDEVNVEIDEWLKTINLPEAKKRKQRETMSSSPAFSMRTARIFMFDDEIDPGGDLTSDDAGTRRICDQILQCIDACLHPDPQRATATFGAPPPGSPGTVEMLHGILGTMRPGMGPATTERLRRQLHAYLEGVARQHPVRRDDGLPDPWDHLRLRCDDIGVRPSVTQLEYAMGFELPEHVVRHEAMECIVLDCAKLCVLVNEILSLEKEFRAGQLENLCLLFVHAEDISIHAALAKVQALIRKHYRSCKAAVARLPWTDDDEQTNEHVRRYVQCCRRIASGTAQWSYVCTRYFGRAQLGEKWEMVATLGQ
ncbi:hypothetical protein PG994_002571 [Apiospora phragmitis]|uniref:Terpene synthase n=1 Tax=Apiospora phragmitis TaxID=2905665 RepID=A0ABR1W5K4_9PEZI